MKLNRHNLKNKTNAVSMQIVGYRITLRVFLGDNVITEDFLSQVTVVGKVTKLITVTKEKQMSSAVIKKSIYTLL
jgi:hypothetical protein